MTKITTDFVGTESAAVTKQRITEILDFWGYAPNDYATWGNARTDLNSLLSGTAIGAIGASEFAGTFLPKINALNDPTPFVVDTLFASGEDGAWFNLSDHDGDFEPGLLFTGGEDGALYSIYEHNGDA